MQFLRLYQSGATATSHVCH